MDIEPTHRRLSAILVADVVGYSRLMGTDDEGTVQARRSHISELVEPHIAAHDGRLVDSTGDALLAEFGSVTSAVTCAVAIQKGMEDRNSHEPDERKFQFRIGINLGDVIVQDGSLFGDGVNVAARLEALAEPGGICIHQTVRDQVRGKLDLDFDDLGEVEAKNIERPVRAYRVRLDEKATAIAARPYRKRPEPKRPSRLWQVAAGALALAVVVGAVWWQPGAPEFEPVPPEEMAQALPTKPSIAVLALDDLSAGGDQGYLNDAISEGIITELSRFSELFVIARNSSFKYREKATDIRDIAAELGVHYVLEGSQQKDGDRLRVTIQLIDALKGSHILAETYDRDLADIFAMQDEIVRMVASRVGGEIAFRPPPTGGLARLSALEHHLKARQAINKYTPESNEQARLLNLKAIEADPTSPFGYLGLVFVYSRGVNHGWGGLSPDEALERARESADKALELGPNNYDAHYARAYVHMLAGERDRAIARFEKAIALNPSATNVMASMAEPMVYAGRVEEAVELLQRAMRLDPHHPEWFKWSLGWAQWAAGDCDTALTTMLSMVKMPNMARKTLVYIYTCLGRQEEADATVATLLENAPGYSIADMRRSTKARASTDVDRVLERSIDALRAAGLPEE